MNRARSASKPAISTTWVRSRPERRKHLAARASMSWVRVLWDMPIASLTAQNSTARNSFSTAVEVWASWNVRRYLAMGIGVGLKALLTGPWHGRRRSGHHPGRLTRPAPLARQTLRRQLPHDPGDLCGTAVEVLSDFPGAGVRPEDLQRRQDLLLDRAHAASASTSKTTITEPGVMVGGSALSQ
jgi:hypothetical protein